jgi:hypothetical protein
METVGWSRVDVKRAIGPNAMFTASGPAGTRGQRVSVQRHLVELVVPVSTVSLPKP